MFAKIIDMAWVKVPFSCPRSAPITRNKNKERAEAKLIKSKKMIGELVKSPILSLLTEKRYPIAVSTKAH